MCRSMQFNVKIFIYVFCRIDNVGILKLRNADVENRVGIQKAKKKSTKARLIFRVQFQKPDGNIQILQVASRSINCSKFYDFRGYNVIRYDQINFSLLTLK